MLLNPNVLNRKNHLKKVIAMKGVEFEAVLYLCDMSNRWYLLQDVYDGTTPYDYKVLKKYGFKYSWVISSPNWNNSTKQEILSYFGGINIDLKGLMLLNGVDVYDLLLSNKLVNKLSRINGDVTESLLKDINKKATGIKNGKRIYGDIITVRIVDSKDAVTAKAREVPYKVLKRITARITEEIPSVVRCLYDITDKPPSTIEFE